MCVGLERKKAFLIKPKIRKMENPSDEVLNAFELIFRALFDPEEGQKKVAPLVTERFDCSIKTGGQPTANTGGY